MKWVKIAIHLRDKQNLLESMAIGAESNQRSKELNIQADAIRTIKDALLEGMSKKQIRKYEAKVRERKKVSHLCSATQT